MTHDDLYAEGIREHAALILRYMERGALPIRATEAEITAAVEEAYARADAAFTKHTGTGLRGHRLPDAPTSLTSSCREGASRDKSDRRWMYYLTDPDLAFERVRSLKATRLVAPRTEAILHVRPAIRAYDGEVWLAIEFVRRSEPEVTATTTRGAWTVETATKPRVEFITWGYAVLPHVPEALTSHPDVVRAYTAEPSPFRPEYGPPLWLLAQQDEYVLEEITAEGSGSSAE